MILQRVCLLKRPEETLQSGRALMAAAERIAVQLPQARRTRIRQNSTDLARSGRLERRVGRQFGTRTMQPLYLPIGGSLLCHKYGNGAFEGHSYP
jgi:hypothetical protein